MMDIYTYIQMQVRCEAGLVASHYKMLYNFFFFFCLFGFTTIVVADEGLEIARG